MSPPPATTAAPRSRITRQSVTATVGSGANAVTGTFDKISGNSPLQPFTLPVGAGTDLTTQWDAAFLESGVPLNGTGNFQVPNDVQVVVSDATGTQVFAVFDAMAQSTNVAETSVQFFNDGSFGTNNFALSFNLVSGPAPTQVRWVSEEDGTDPQALDEGGADSLRARPRYRRHYRRGRGRPHADRGGVVFRPRRRHADPLRPERQPPLDA